MCISICFWCDCGFLCWYIGENSSKASNKCRMDNTEITSVHTGELRSAARPIHHCLKTNGNELFSIKAELQLIPWKQSLREGFGEFCWQWHPLSPLFTSGLSSHMLWDAQQMWSQEGFLVCPPAKSLQGSFALLTHFPQAKAVRGTSCSSTVTEGRHLAAGPGHASNELWAHATSLQALERHYVCNRHKPLLGLTWGLWGADRVHIVRWQRIENWVRWKFWSRKA